MDLKAFKGMPHEFGGIDYTDGSEVEGGEFAVNIGKSGNEYIFDKDSSEGAKLSKEYKRLDTNGRLGEDDPIALETFNQIAKEEALKHAQRSVNEKGVDPFRNMYDEGGKAANGGVKYANGGAKDMYFTGGGMGSMSSGFGGMGSSSGGATGGMGNFGSIMGGVQGGLDMFSQFQTPDVNFDAMFTPDADPMFANPQRYQNIASNNTSQQRLATDPMTPMPTMDEYQLPAQSTPEMPTADASYNVSSSGANDANKKAQEEYNSKIEQCASAGADIGGMIGGLVRGNSKAGQLKEPVSFREVGDKRHRSRGPEFHKMSGNDYFASHLEGAASGAMTGLQTAGPWGALAGAVGGGIFAPIKAKMQEDKLQKEATNQFNMKLLETGEEETSQSMARAIARDVDGTSLIDKDRYAGVMRDGGAKKGIYGYYANGGGKKKKGTVLEVNPENVTADGSQVLEYPYLLDEVVVEDKLDRTDPYAVSNWSKENDPIAHSVREAGSDFMNNATGGNLMPSNAKAYIHGILGRRKPFTEADLTPSEIEAMSKSLDEGMGVTDEYTQAQYDSGVPKYDQNAYVSYDDWNRQGASSLYDNTLRHLTDPASRMKTLVGSSPVTDGGTYRDVGPNKYDFDDYTDTPFSEMTFLNMAEHIYNQSPFIKEQKSKGKPPMNMRFRIPKKTK